VVLGRRNETVVRDGISLLVTQKAKLMLVFLRDMRSSSQVVHKSKWLTSSNVNIK